MMKLESNGALQSSTICTRISRASSAAVRSGSLAREVERRAYTVGDGALVDHSGRGDVLQCRAGAIKHHRLVIGARPTRRTADDIAELRANIARSHDTSFDRVVEIADRGTL